MDENKLAHKIVQKSTKCKNPAAVALGKLGASKGGKARAKKLSKERRVEIAMMGVEARRKKRNKT